MKEHVLAIEMHLNILHPNLSPVSKLANEQLGVAKT